MEKKILISANTAKEMQNILQRYIDKYGNITISKLLDKMETNFLILC